MNREQLIQSAKYIQFPNSKTSYREYGELPGRPKVARLPLTDRMYSAWPLNSNHFYTSYHIDTVLPKLAEVLDFPFSRDDFSLDERTSESGFDISVLIWRKDVRFDIYGLSRNEEFQDVDYRFLTESHINCSGITEYHKLYRFPHTCSRIINKTTTSSRRLFISGDSQMIPDIAPIACYFKEVWYMDNRDNGRFSEMYKDIEFTDVIFELNNNAISFYLDLNIK